MLTLARHLGAPLAGYHPRGASGAAAGGRRAGRDGRGRCAARAGDRRLQHPTFPLTLTQLPARSHAWPRRRRCRPARRRLRADPRRDDRHPRLVAGTGRACTAIMTAAARACWSRPAPRASTPPRCPSSRLGLALKVEDGAGRAAPVALLALLEALGALARRSPRRLGERAAAGAAQPCRRGSSGGSSRQRAGRASIGRARHAPDRARRQISDR